MEQVKERHEVQQEEHGGGVIPGGGVAQRPVATGDLHALTLQTVSPGLWHGRLGDDLRQELVEQLDDALVLAGQVVEADAVLEHAAVLAVGGNGFDDLKEEELKSYYIEKI